eukprot:6196153-Pleurochrysis_carterae.AAC.1
MAGFLQRRSRPRSSQGSIAGTCCRDCGNAAPAIQQGEVGFMLWCSSGTIWDRVDTPGIAPA